MENSQENLHVDITAYRVKRKLVVYFGLASVKK